MADSRSEENRSGGREDKRRGENQWTDAVRPEPVVWTPAIKEGAVVVKRSKEHKKL